MQNSKASAVWSVDPCWLSKRKPHTTAAGHHDCPTTEFDVAVGSADRTVSFTSFLGKSKSVADVGLSPAASNHSPAKQLAVCVQPSGRHATTRQRLHSQDTHVLLLSHGQLATSDTGSLKQSDQRAASDDGSQQTANQANSKPAVSLPIVSHTWLISSGPSEHRGGHLGSDIRAPDWSSCATAAPARMQMPQYQDHLLSDEVPMMNLQGGRTGSMYESVRSAAVLPSSGDCTPDCLSPVSHSYSDPYHAAALQDALMTSSLASQPQ